MRLPPLSVLRAFEATVRHASVRMAARELNLTDGAVSRAVRDLERDLEATLFLRANRSVVPTATARELATGIGAGLERLARSLEAARQDRDTTSRPLVLSCEPTLLMRWLIPRLSGLQDALGRDTDLRLVAAGGPVAFARDGIDLAIRRADFALAPGTRSEPFLAERVGPVCRPEIADQLGTTGPIALPILHSLTRPDAWMRWSAATGTPLRPEREQRFEHFYLTLQAAAAGNGVAIGPVALVCDDVRAGVLVAPRGFTADGTSYVLTAPAKDDDQSRFEVVLAWLKDATMAFCER